MSRPERIVVVGAGLCGLRAAERLRELGFEGDVVIVGNEPTPPYHRPALSKQLLAGSMRPDDLLLPAYQNVNAKWRLNTPVQYLLPRSRTLRLPGDEELKYDGLIIATGVEARRANDVPYEDPRVCVMRTLPDALDFERVLSENRSGPVVVVGGGFTGCELASSLRSLGREVTLIQRGKSLLGNVLGQDLGNWLTKMHGDHGVDLALGNSVKRWAPREDGVALQLSDGSTMLAACVMLATGTVPSTSWLRGSGLPLDNGVVCEATCHVVGAEDVVAAGDVAQWPNIRFDNVPRRIEHWLNAIEMGRAAAENLLAGRAAATPFTPMPRFWTEQYGVRIQAAGVPKLGPDIVALGSPTDGTGTVVGYAKEGRLMGVVGVDCPSSVMAWTESVANQNPVPGDQPVESDAPAMPAPAAPAAARESVSASSATRAPAASAAPASSATGTRMVPAARTRRPASSSTRLSSPGERQQRTRGFAASAERKKGRHSLPPRETRRPRENPAEASGWNEAVDPAASYPNMPPADPAASNPNMPPAMNPAASYPNMRPADPAASNPNMPPAMNPAASSARMNPVMPPVHPAASSARMNPVASNPNMPPVAPGHPRPGSGGLVDSDGRLVDATGRIGRIDPRGDLVAEHGPASSHARIQPVGNGGRAMGPAASNARMRPADGRMMPGSRPGPEDSYERLPAVPPINDRLRSAGSGGRGPGSSGRMGPADSYDRIPPVDREGRGPAGSYGRMRPANGFRPGPEDSYDNMPPAYPGGPVDSYRRLPPVNSQAYDQPRLGTQPWENRSAGRAEWGPQQRGPADSWDRMPPARLGPVDSYDNMPPVRPEDVYGAFPPARRLGPEDSYDRFPPARRGPMDSDGMVRPVQRRRH